MGRELGRISGPLLAENLLRNGNNLAFETNLLYLDVVNGWVGIKNATPTRTLNITGKTDTTNLIVDTSATVANLEFTTSQIQNVSGSVTLSPNQSLNPTVNVPRLTTAFFDITTNSINNTVLNSNIVLDPMGTGQLVVTTTNVDIRGSLHATGNITWDGSVVLGDNDTDNVTFNADINSNIIPNVNNASNLGSAIKEWRNLYSHNLTSSSVTSSSLLVNGINVLKTQGKTIYVSVNGNDSKTGTHLHDPYLTIKKALSVAVAGDKIVIFPGIYTEIFPLTVPQGVSVNGTNIRTVVVKPTDATRFKDAFLLNGETAVSDLTVGNFYYNPTDNTGYGFRLATNCLVTTRSPYVQNVTVLNNNNAINFQNIVDGEYSTSAIVDILNGGDSAGVFVDITDGSPSSAGGSGRGALVDGSVVNVSSKEATILFSAVTMIVPDADGVTATNGARVEWLSSFTYFANRGIYLLEGTLGFASLGVKFGAELRSINSANIYGTYGAVADGTHALGYLIGHNFSYVGSALDSQNDNALVIQANETVELNSGRIYYDSVDQKGNYRIGDIFLVNQLTGNLSFTSQSITYTGNSSITLDNGSGRTFISAAGLEVSNIRINTNNISSATGPVNFLAFNGSTYLNTNVTVTGNTNVSGDTNVKGSVTLGNEATDTITIYDRLTQSVNPKVTNTYTLGKITGTPKIWNTLYANLLNVDAVTRISSNTITTLTTDTDLVLNASGTGQIYVATTDVDIANNLTVLGSSNVQAVGVVGTLDLPGSFTYTQTGSVTRTGATSITGNVTVNGANIVQFQDIKFDGNKIATTLANNDLTFTANGTGIVKVINTDVQVDNNLTVSLTSNANNVTATSATANAFDIGSVYITGNTITTDVLNTNLVLSANGTGIINVTLTDVTLTNNLTVNGSSALASVGITGTLNLPGTPIAYTYVQTGNTSRIGDTNITGNVTVNGINVVQFQDVKFDSNKITTTVGNNDLKFTANGTGIVKVINSDVQVDNDLTVSLTGYFGSAQVNTRVTSTDLYVDSIYIVGNSVTTIGTDTNLLLGANGTGKINVATTDVTITNNLTVNGSSTLTDIGLTGTLSLPGAFTYAQTGNVNRTGNTGITGTLTVNPAGLTTPVIQFQNINITSNDITTTVTNSDLIFTTVGTSDIIDGGAYSITIDNTVDGGNASVVNLQSVSGGFSNLSYDNIINVINTDVQIDNSLTVKLTLNANSLQTAGGITAVDFNVGSLYIKDNISVVPSNTNLILKAYTGKNVHLLTSDVNVAQNLTVAGPFTVDGTGTLKAVTVVGAITQTGNIVQTGNTGVTGTFGVTGNITVTGPSSFLSVNNVKLDNNIISATATDANLELRANGVGGVVLERYLKFTNNTISNIFDSNNIDLAFNNLLVTEDGQNLILESGDLILADTLLDTDFSIKFTPNGTGNLVIDSNKAFTIAYGNNANRILTSLGEIRQNSTTKVYEGKSGAGNVSFNNIYDTDGNTYITPELTPGANDNILRFGINGTVKATISSTKLFSDTLHADNVRISGTTIDNLDNSNDLILAPNGTGTVKVNNVSVAGNKFTNNANTALVFENIGTGYVQFAGTYGIIIPRGTNVQRAITPETGETRYNTTANYLEIYDGAYWVSASGSGNVATLDEIQAELDLWSLVLG